MQRCQEYWNVAMPLWPDEDEPESKTRHLPSYFLGLLQGVLEKTADLDFVGQELGHYWYVMGNIGDEIFEWRETDVTLASAYYALLSSYLALCDPFRLLPLKKNVKLENKTDESLMNSYNGDCAGATLLAIIGAGKYEKDPSSSAQHRLDFWKWWLTEAIPEAWQLVEGV